MKSWYKMSIARLFYSLSKSGGKVYIKGTSGATYDYWGIYLSSVSTNLTSFKTHMSWYVSTYNSTSTWSVTTEKSLSAYALRFSVPGLFTVFGQEYQYNGTGGGIYILRGATGVYTKYNFSQYTNVVGRVEGEESYHGRKRLCLTVPIQSNVSYYLYTVNMSSTLGFSFLPIGIQLGPLNSGSVSNFYIP